MSQQNIKTYLHDNNGKFKITDTAENGINPNLFIGSWLTTNKYLETFDAFITGYGFIIWTLLPKIFDKDEAPAFKLLTERNFKGFSGNSDYEVQTAEMQAGFSNNVFTVATSTTKGNTDFTLKHYEFTGSPMRELYQKWVFGICDPYTGLANYGGKLQTNEIPKWSNKNHTGELMYVVTDPSGAAGSDIPSGIEYAGYYTAVFPTKVPRTHLDYNSGDHQVAELEIPYKGILNESAEVNRVAAELFKNYQITASYADWGANLLDMKASDGYISTHGFNQAPGVGVAKYEKTEGSTTSNNT
jgi:hypothetical protein